MGCAVSFCYPLGCPASETVSQALDFPPFYDSYCKQSEPLEEQAPSASGLHFCTFSPFPLPLLDPLAAAGLQAHGPDSRDDTQSQGRHGSKVVSPAGDYVPEAAEPVYP